jgi:hypothetical protein
MIDYETKIISLITISDVIPNFVTSANFRIIGTLKSNPTITASVDSFVNFNIDPEQTEFSPYDKLTETDVLLWIDPTVIGSLQCCIQEQINVILNPPIIPEETPLPWASE